MHGLNMKSLLKVTMSACCLVMLSTVAVKANSCDADVQRFCSDVQPGHGTLSQCLQQHASELSYGCREWLGKMDKVLRRIGNACGDAARQYCRDVKPGYGAVKNCLMANFDKLPNECQTALKAAGQ